MARVHDLSQAQDDSTQAKLPRLAVGAVIVDSDGRILLVRRARPPLAGAWSLPGGRVEPGEPLEAALIREIREETSLDVRIISALGPVTLTREGMMYVIHEHLAIAPEGARARAGDDAADVRWTTRAELRSLGVRDDAVAVIDEGLAVAERHGLISTHAAACRA